LTKNFPPIAIGFLTMALRLRCLVFFPHVFLFSCQRTMLSKRP